MRIGNFNWIVPFEIKIQLYYPIQTELELYELDFPIKSWTGWQSAPDTSSRKSRQLKL